MSCNVCAIKLSSFIIIFAFYGRSYHMTQWVISIMAPDSDSKKLNNGFACGPIFPRVIPSTVANTTSPRILVPGTCFSTSSHSSILTNKNLSVSHSCFGNPKNHNNTQQQLINNTIFKLRIKKRVYIQM